jgi:P-type conjugative transfer protein TrbG
MRYFNVVVFGSFLIAPAMASNPGEVIYEAHKNASDEPQSQQYLNAAMIYDWQPNRVYQVYTKPGRITDIALEPQEDLISVAGGDSQRWTITDTLSGLGEEVQKHIFVKPHQMGISSNLVLTTNKRVYHIELHSLEHIPYQAVVSWDYPGSIMISNNFSLDGKPIKPVTPLSGLMNAQLNFNYHFVATERPAWMPRRVFDDGHKTYIEFPESMQATEAPILWGLTKSKEQEVLNYRRYKNFYILDHLIDLAELSIGEKSKVVVGIEREVK